jgi:hypothetical protein
MDVPMTPPPTIKTRICRSASLSVVCAAPEQAWVSACLSLGNASVLQFSKSDPDRSAHLLSSAAKLPYARSATQLRPNPGRRLRRRRDVSAQRNAALA